MKCDVVCVCLPGSDVNRLQVFVLDFPDSKGFIREDSISIEGSLAGIVFRTGKPWAGNASDLLQLGVKDGTRTRALLRDRQAFFATELRSIGKG